MFTSVNCDSEILKNLIELMTGGWFFFAEILTITVRDDQGSENIWVRDVDENVILFRNVKSHQPFQEGFVLFVAIAVVSTIFNISSNVVIDVSDNAELIGFDMTMSDAVAMIDMYSHQSANCWNCNVTNAQSKCVKCVDARYCSRTCQVNHWPEHKKCCKGGCPAFSPNLAS